MSTISVTELKRQPVSQWRKSARAGNLVVMSQGEPVALLLAVDDQSLEPTLAALRSVRALRAQAELQRAAEENGRSAFTMTDINAEIEAVRRGHRRK